MLASDQPTRVTREKRSTVRGDRRQRAASVVARYRVAAVPVFTATADDVIIRDQQGQSYLLAQDSAVPTPLDQAEVDALGMFFEASLDVSWHTEPELRDMFYGSDEVALGNA